MFLTVALATVSGCDRQPDAIIVPEYEFAFSFESGLGGWVSHTADLGTGTATIDATQDRASAGSRSALVTVSNAGAAKVWMTQPLEVTPGKRYSIELSFDLSTEDHTGVAPWGLVVGVGGSEPTAAAELTILGTTASELDSATGPEWITRSHTLVATADDEGFLYLTLGISGTSVGDRSYAFDNVSLVLTRM